MSTWRSHLFINNAIAPFNNVRVRQAMAWDVNRMEIVDTALFGVGCIFATGWPFRRVTRAYAQRL
ncbi:MAG: hypothetical protein FJX78_05540 [Armatimonadetes bacterium]|nr:hypothetical protein [Armatimonadota bacterium]